MPTYDYVCDACDHEFEEFQSITAKHLKKCPECGKNKLRRLIGTGAGIIFKGSGFYETDYRSDSYQKAARADRDSSKSDSKASGDSKSDSSKSEAKSDTKPAKTESKSASASSNSSKSGSSAKKAD